MIEKVKSETNTIFQETTDLPMEKRAPRRFKTHAGDMQKLYLAAPAQCRGAGQNVKPQKYDPLW